MALNAFGLIGATFFKSLGIIYFCLTFTTILLYYIIDMVYEPSQAKENWYKILLVLIISLVGGVYPLFNF